MVYLLVLEVFLIYLVFSLKVGVLYFVIKFFNHAVTLSKLLKIVVLFEVAILAFYLLVSFVVPHGSFLPIFLFPTAFGALFVFFMHKFSFLDWRKGLIVFILFFVVVTPLAS